MHITALTAADLRNLIRLVEQKEQLLARVAEIDAQLAGVKPGQANPPPIVEAAATAKRKRGPRRPVATKPEPTTAEAVKPGKRTRRGALKAAIIDLLQESGEAGLRVTEIASKLGASLKSVYVWFMRTGKEIAEIERIGPAHHRWRGGAPEPPTEARPASKPATPRPGKAAGNKRGRGARK